MEYVTHYYAYHNYTYFIKNEKNISEIKEKQISVNNGELRKKYIRMIKDYRRPDNCIGGEEGKDYNSRAEQERSVQSRKDWRV